MQNSEVKRALSIEEFAERWSIGRNSVYNAIARGELGSVKIGKRRVITLEQEEAFRELMERKSA
jgi:excisionase family DNA binding protein